MPIWSQKSLKTLVVKALRYMIELRNYGQLAGGIRRWAQHQQRWHRYTHSRKGGTRLIPKATKQVGRPSYFKNVA